MKAFGNADEVGAAAVDYLRICGHLVFAYFWARMAKVALAKQGQRRPVLHRQAAHGALLLRQAAARDGRPDPQRARRRGAADGDGRSAVLSPTPHPVNQGDNHEEDPFAPWPWASPPLRPAPRPRRWACGRPSTTRPSRRSRFVRIVDSRRRAQRPDREARSTPTKQDSKCDKCTDERKDQPVLGMTIVEGVKKNADEPYWDGGTILDPNNGKTYKVRMTPKTAARRSRCAATSARSTATQHLGSASSDIATGGIRESIPRPQGGRARRRRDGRADRRPSGQLQGAGRAVRPAGRRKARRTASSPRPSRG